MVHVTKAIHPIFSIGTGFGRRQFSRRMSRSLQAICFLIFHLILLPPILKAPPFAVARPLTKG